MDNKNFLPTYVNDMLLFTHKYSECRDLDVLLNLCGTYVANCVTQNGNNSYNKKFLAG